jgi:hypothetical protein
LITRSCGISIPLGATGGFVGHDTASDESTKFFKLLGQSILIDAPSDVANEQVLAGARVVLGLGFLSNCTRVVLGLALLGWSFNGSLTVLLFVRGAIRAGTGTGVGGRVVRVLANVSTSCGRVLGCGVVH